MKRLAPCFFILLFSSCVSVAGRLRPAWSPGWSEIVSQASSVSDNVEVRVFLNEPEQVLPGVEITAERLGGESSGAQMSGTAVTNASGVAFLSLSPGTWRLRGELVSVSSVSRKLLIHVGKRYVVKMYTTLAHTEPITVY